MRRRKLIAVIAILLFVAIGILLTIRINLKYPKAEELIYQMDEEVPYGDDIYVHIDNVRFLSEEEKAQIHSFETESGFNFKSMVVTLSVTNKGTDERSAELYPMMLVTGAFANASEQFAFQKLNENSECKTLRPTLKPGEVVTVQMPFLLYDSHFFPDDWEQVKEREFKLVFNLYPQKESIKLSLSE